MKNQYWVWWCRYNEKYSIYALRASSRNHKDKANAEGKSFKYINGLLIKLKIVFPWSQNGSP